MYPNPTKKCKDTNTNAANNLKNVGRTDKRDVLYRILLTGSIKIYPSLFFRPGLFSPTDLVLPDPVIQTRLALGLLVHRAAARAAQGAFW
jgi:hypothetical protein